MNSIKSILLLTMILMLGAGYSQNTFIVKSKETPVTIQPTMWGIFFEDINLAADGGIYAELVKNRSFEFDAPLMGWKELKQNKTDGSLLVINRREERPSNPRFVRATVNTTTGYGISNEGFRGMGIKQGNGYDFSLWAKQFTGAQTKLKIELVNETGGVIAVSSLVVSGNEWKKYAVSFNATETSMKARLNIWLEGVGAIDMDMVSLFPKDTWKNRPGGLRADLVQLLADLKPGFIRFPGGCIVEGRDLANRYQWKTTVGAVEDRKLIMNRWNVEFKHRATPDYFQSFGLGFYEYFQLAEDIGAAPLPIINCGIACQFNTGEVTAANELDPYIQDALDLIEFANGNTSTKWGALRAAMGHPAPFNLQMMGVGNENWGPEYIERLKVFSAAIKAKYPEIKLINSSGTDPVGERFDYLNTELRKMNADLIDEHYYRPPSWFLENAARYDGYNRNGSKVFAGEYAAHSKVPNGDKKNNWESALAEAAFMTGLERNADVVFMASYAPLFAHADGWQWTPDLIWFNNLQCYGTPNYYVQKLFSVNKGSEVMSLLSNGKAVSGQDSLYATACVDKATNELIIKFVNASGKEQQSAFKLADKKLVKQGTLTVLKADDATSANSFETPQNIIPKTREIVSKSNSMELNFAPNSVNVIRIKMQK